MNTKIIVFTSPTCPHCPSALKLAKEVEKECSGVKVEEISTATRQGSILAGHYSVMSVPTIFVRGSAYPQNIGFRGTPPKDRLLKAIAISQGKETFEQEEKSGFFSKLKEKLGM